MRDEIPHNFPQPHTDVIENIIDYKVSPEKYDELGNFDKSVYVDRTRGEVSARCDMEAANIIALNLMHEIVTGKCSAEEARDKFGEASSAFLLDLSAPYAEKFLFDLPQDETSDPDETNIAGAMLDLAGEKIKDKISGKDSKNSG